MATPRFDCSLPPVGKFERNDAVEKFTGDYVWAGIVASVFWTPAGALRYVVAHEVPHTGGQGWVCHVYSESNLRKAEAA